MTLKSTLVIPSNSLHYGVDFEGKIVGYNLVWSW